MRVILVGFNYVKLWGEEGGPRSRQAPARGASVTADGQDVSPTLPLAMCSLSRDLHVIETQMAQEKCHHENILYWEFVVRLWWCAVRFTAAILSFRPFLEPALNYPSQEKVSGRSEPNWQAIKNNVHLALNVRTAQWEQERDTLWIIKLPKFLIALLNCYKNNMLECWLLTQIVKKQQSSRPAVWPHIPWERPLRIIAGISSFSYFYLHFS